MHAWRATSSSRTPRKDRTAPIRSSETLSNYRVTFLPAALPRPPPARRRFAAEPFSPAPRVDIVAVKKEDEFDSV